MRREADLGADLVVEIGWWSDGCQRIGKRGQPALPSFDRGLQRAVLAEAAFDGCALVVVERAEHILSRRAIDVVELGHCSRQPFNCARLR